MAMHGHTSASIHTHQLIIIGKMAVVGFELKTIKHKACATTIFAPKLVRLMTTKGRMNCAAIAIRLLFRVA